MASTDPDELDGFDTFKTRHNEDVHKVVLDVIGGLLDRVEAADDQLQLPPSVSIGDDIIVFRKAPKRSLNTSESGSSLGRRPKKIPGLVDYSSSSDSSSSTDSDDDSTPEFVPEWKRKIQQRQKRIRDDEEDPEFIGPRRPQEDDEEAVQPRRRPPVLLNRENPVLDSDDDDDQEADVDTKEEEEDLGSLPDFLKPNWYSLKSLRDREYGGWKKRISLQSDFVYRVSSSLSCVQRFELLCKLKHHQGCVNSLQFNDSGTKLVTGSDDLNIVIWDWVKGSAVPRDKVGSVRAGSGRGRRIFSNVDDSDSQDDAAILTIYASGHRSNVFQAKFMPFTNDATVVSCARDGQVRAADISSDGSCRGTRRLATHKGSAHKLATFCDSSNSFLSCGEDGVVKAIDLRCDKPTDLLVTRAGEKKTKVPLYSIHSNPLNAHEFITSGKDPQVRFYDRRMIKEEDEEEGSSRESQPHLKAFCPHVLSSQESTTRGKANVTCTVFSHDGSQILASYNDEDIYLFDSTHSDRADAIKRYQGHRNNATVKGVNFYGPKSEYVVSGSDCGHIFIWDKESENVVQFLKGDEGGVVNVLEPHPSMPFLATSGLDHDVKIWSPTNDYHSGPDFSALLKTMKKNGKEREEETGNEGRLLDGHMLWFLMQHLRRRRRQRAGQRRPGEEEEDEDGDPRSSDDEDDEDDDEPDDAAAAESNIIDCNPS